MTALYPEISNYQLWMMPNGVCRAKELVCDNPLYPLYYFQNEDHFLVSTSVFELILAKGQFVRNIKFHNVYSTMPDPIRPSWSTIDAEVHRLRITLQSSFELTDPQVIVSKAADVIQQYVTEVEGKYPNYTHVLFMGGKDSENIILCKRKSPWIVVTGEPNVSLNRMFLERNKVDISQFISLSNDADDSVLTEEILASDCFWDIAHFRWTRALKDLWEKHNRRVVVWLGSAGDGMFSWNAVHRAPDFYALQHLHVAVEMGVQHQVWKNIFDIPVLSPYHSPAFLREVLYRMDPSYIQRGDDFRPVIGHLLHGREVHYPRENPFPPDWPRDRHRSIPIYIAALKKRGIPCVERRVTAKVAERKLRVIYFLDKHSAKRRTRLSKVLFPLRNALSKVIPLRRRFHFKEIL